MKKILLCFLFSFVCIISNAQIYNTIKYLDKFDDVIKQENVKTLVTETDSTFIFETKGRKPKIYYILEIDEDSFIGDADENNHERLVNNIFGYQESYFVSDIPYNKFIILDEDEQKKHFFTLVHRVISRYSFTFEYDSEFHWIRSLECSRIVYENK